MPSRSSTKITINGNVVYDDSKGHRSGTERHRTHGSGSGQGRRDPYDDGPVRSSLNRPNTGQGYGAGNGQGHRARRQESPEPIRREQRRETAPAPGFVNPGPPPRSRTTDDHYAPPRGPQYYVPQGPGPDPRFYGGPGGVPYPHVPPGEVKGSWYDDSQRKRTNEKRSSASAHNQSYVYGEASSANGPSTSGGIPFRPKETSGSTGNYAFNGYWAYGQTGASTTYPDPETVIKNRVRDREKHAGVMAKCIAEARKFKDAGGFPEGFLNRMAEFAEEALELRYDNVYDNEAFERDWLVKETSLVEHYVSGLETGESVSIKCKKDPKLIKNLQRAIEETRPVLDELKRLKRYYSMAG